MNFQMRFCMNTDSFFNHEIYLTAQINCLYLFNDGLIIQDISENFIACKLSLLFFSRWLLINSRL